MESEVKKGATVLWERQQPNGNETLFTILLAVSFILSSYNS